jgi:hypothetical protein
VQAVAQHQVQAVAQHQAQAVAQHQAQALQGGPQARPAIDASELLVPMSSVMYNMYESLLRRFAPREPLEWEGKCSRQMLRYGKHLVEEGRVRPYWVLFI